MENLRNSESDKTEACKHGENPATCEICQVNPKEFCSHKKNLNSPCIQCLQESHTEQPIWNAIEDIKRKSKYEKHKKHITYRMES